MRTRSGTPLYLAASLLLAGAALLAMKPAHAALAPLDDAALAQVNGRAAPPWAPPQRSDRKLDSLPLVGGLLSLFTPGQMKLDLLDRAGFEAALASRGMGALPDSLYDGRPVLQLALDAPPVNLQMEAGRFLLQNFGLDYQGPSFGTINITHLDARGTTFWIWKH